MKKIVYTLVAILALATSCNSNTKATSQEAVATQGDVVEVLYFHGKQRCITCNAIERLTTEVINEVFADEVKSGKLAMKVIDISTKEGEAIADNYEVSWSSLFFNKWEEGKESRNNMTEVGFAKAKNEPEAFKAAIQAKLTELVK